MNKKSELNKIKLKQKKLADRLKADVLRERILLDSAKKHVEYQRKSLEYYLKRYEEFKRKKL